ncbi:DUF4351 domain-containing protein [Coleofasciculus sp. E1-EBD-02]|uniref:DUF4351 domain-containing protein n=1 Tax=Coleofasciculus sp. E1-EBD-02 TaxID=3068481 RepID=UPI0032FE9A6A
MNYDNACKYLAEQYPAEFVSWLLSVQSPDIQVLKTELTLEPLASLTQTDTPQGLLAQVAEQTATIPDREQRQTLAGFAEILAGLRFEKALIRRFFREDIMRESVIYQDILQQGRQQEALSLVMRLLKRRLGEVKPSAIERVRALSIEELEELGVALLDFSGVADLVAWFNRQKMRDVEIALIIRQLTRRLGDVDPSLRDRINRLSTEQLEALGVTLLDFFQVADLVAWLEEQQMSD